MSSPHLRDRRYKDASLRRDSRRNHLLFALAFAAACVYIGWLVTAIDWHHSVVGSLFLAAEIVCGVSVFLWGTMLATKRLHPKEGLPWEGEPPPVDVLIAVCHEPMEVVRPTLLAVAAIDYPHACVTVLDDGRSDELKAIAEQLGFAYSARERRHFAKSGNLNHGLTITSAPFVLALDADQVPHPEIIDRLVGFFQVPTIGLVASRQVFDLPPGDPWGNADSVFYDAMQPGKNAANAAISCGSGVMYRRQALESVGGFPTWSLVEDLYVSMLMEKSGWRGVYYAFALAEGTAPTDVFAQHRQRWQWAVDSLRIMFWRCPLFTRGLGWRQRLDYVHFGWHYVTYGMAYPVFFLLPIWSLFTGEFVLRAPVWVFLAYRLPYLVFARLMTSFLTEHGHGFKAFQMQVGLWPVFLSAIWTAVTHPFTRPRYVVTVKVVRSTSLFRRALALRPNLAVMMLSVAAILYGLIASRETPVYLAVMVFWCLWTIVALSRFTFVGLSASQGCPDHAV